MFTTILGWFSGVLLVVVLFINIASRDKPGERLAQVIINGLLLAYVILTMIERYSQ